MAQGDLCYKYGSTSLAYKHGGSALIYKGEAPGAITLSIAFKPVTWVCYTYDASHYGILLVTTLWNNTSYNISSSPYEITIGASYLHASTLKFTISTKDVCQAHEDPGVSACIAATQNGRTVVSNFIVSPLQSQTKTITITLSGGFVQSISE